MATANFFAPGFDDQVEQQNIERQRQYAQALRKQSQEPMAQGQMVGKHFVAPSFTQGLAKMLQSYYAGQGESQADEQQKALAAAITGRRAEEWGKVAPMLSGTPAREIQPLTPNDDDGNVNPVIQVDAQKPDLRGAYAQALQSKDPSLQQFGMQGMTKLPEMEAAQQERTDNRAWRTQESETARAARAEELRIRGEDSKASQAERLAAQKELREMQIAAQKEGREMQIAAQREARQMIAANRPERQAQIIETENGPMQLVGGKAVPIVGPTGQQVAGKAGAKSPQSLKVQDAKDALSTIALAEKLINEATGSGIGSAIDATAGFFGHSTEGAQGSAKLKALEGDLVSKMPKMSGPQSDKDVILYRQMAGTIGDPTIPRETKKAALKTIREIQGRYAGLDPASDSSPVAEPPANRPPLSSFKK